MLAKIECQCLLDLGITESISSRLRNGPVYIGESLLSDARLQKSLRTGDVGLLFRGLTEFIAFNAYLLNDPTHRDKLGIENPTFGIIPRPTQDELERNCELAERQVLAFASQCILRGNILAFDQLISQLPATNGFVVRKDFHQALSGVGPRADFNLVLAGLLHDLRQDVEGNELLRPVQIFDATMKIVQLSKTLLSKELVLSSLYEWLSQKWVFVWSQQRFLLRNPALHETSIADAFATKSSRNNVLVAVLIAVLPTFGISNEDEMSGHLKGLIEGS